MKNILIVVLCWMLLIPTHSFGEAIITEKNLGTPSFLTLSIAENQFVLSWKNPYLIFGLGNVEYQVDYKVGRGEWASINKELKSTYLPFSTDERTTIVIDPTTEGLGYIDLNNTNYSFRVRYVLRYFKDGASLKVDGSFSSPVSLGLKSYYQNASNWAFVELDRAVELQLISDTIRDDMKKEITREEFSAIVVRLYELQTGNTINYEGQSFADTNNPEVLKAAKIGVVKGVGGGKFLPNNLVTRQEIAVMLVRALKAIHPQMDFSYGAVQPTTESNIASWAIEDVNFMRYKGILRGDSKGLINPLGHTTREEAVILTLRTHDTFK